MHRRITTTMFATMTALIVALALHGPAVPTADAHRPNPTACQAAWKAAPPGERWNAYQRCRSAQLHHQLQHTCTAKRPPIPRGVTVKHHPADRAQRDVLTRALAYARRTDTPTNVQVAMIAAITQESGARNLRYGHGTSVGVLQLIDLHGSVAWRLVIENSAGWFLRGAATIPGHRTTSPGTLAQQVQRSGYPDAYHRWVPEARRTLNAYLGPCRR
jgi:hypothetical protein